MCTFRFAAEIPIYIALLDVYFRGGGQRNQDLLESGHTITPAAKNSLPHPCPCAVEDMPPADSDGLTTLPQG